MLHLVSTSAGTSGIFVGASQGQGFVIPHDQSDYRAPTRLFWVPALLLVPVILLFVLYAWRYSLAPLLDFLGLFGLGLFPVDVYFKFNSYCRSSAVPLASHTV